MISLGSFFRSCCSCRQLSSSSTVSHQTTCAPGKRLRSQPTRSFMSSRTITTASPPSGDEEVRERGAVERDAEHHELPAAEMEQVGGREERRADADEQKGSPH